MPRRTQTDPAGGETAATASGPLQLGFEDLPAAQQLPPEHHTWTVSEIVRQASEQIEGLFGEIWVEGEVSNLRQPRSGHIYFTLKDDRAQLQVVMFRSSASRLKFRVEDGQKLRCRGRLGIYESQGRFQLTAQTAEPTGIGALQMAFEQLKAKLLAEGLFDDRHKRPLPVLPRTIAVVTSPSGAAIRDIIRVLHRRCPVRVVVCPTSVQGAEAPREIVRALGRADRLGADLVIVGRGGGSLEDLWAFNTEEVARAIFAMRTPVISAVGHEVDISISDMVADRRAPTPSAAAEIAVPVMSEVTEQIRLLRLRLSRALGGRLREKELLLARLRGRMISPRRRLDRGRMELDDLAVRLETALRRRLRRGEQVLLSLRTRLAAQQPRVRLARDRATLQGLHQGLVSQVRRCLELRRGKLARCAAQLQALSPLAVLARGFAVVTDEARRLVRDAKELQVGDSLHLRLSRGAADCTVDALEEGEEN